MSGSKDRTITSDQINVTNVSCHSSSSCRSSQHLSHDDQCDSDTDTVYLNANVDAPQSHINDLELSSYHMATQPSNDTQNVTVTTENDSEVTMTAIPGDPDRSIDLNRQNMVLARLPNNDKLLSLIDSGASDNLICATLVTQSPYLSKLPRIPTPSVRFKVGNGQYINSRFAIEFPIFIQKHQFIVRALALDTLGGIDLVIGSPALREIDACLDFACQKLRFKHTTFTTKLTRSIQLRPHQSMHVTVTSRLPAPLRHATLLLRPSRFVAGFTASHMLVKFRNGYATILLHNPTDRHVTLSRDKLFGILDLRHLTSIYTHILATSQSDTQTVLFCQSGEKGDENHYNSVQSSTKTGANSNAAENSKLSRKQLYEKKLAEFPFLDPSDDRLKMFDHEILDRDIKFCNTPLDLDQQQKVKKLLMKYPKALSLHSEVGNTNLEIDFELTDTTPFYIRPFSVSPSEKPIIDKELKKLVDMGVLEEHHSAYSSPVMLLRKRNSTDYRLVSDFRFLNNRLVRRNLPFPLLKESLQTIGAAKPKILSVLDLKQAYYCLNLSAKCRDYCGISSYYGGKHFRYLKLPMGISLAPAVFQQHINSILDACKANDYTIGIMDDLLIFSDSIEQHYRHVETILKALSDNGLKIAPSKAKLFRTKVVYMGHEIMTSKNQPSIRALRDRTEAITKMPIPTTKRQVKSFIGKVAYLSMYLKNLQVLLKPLHKISGKNSEFKWTEEQQVAYNAIIQLLIKPPVLSLPRSDGLFRLYVDTSKIGTGASLWQVQDGEERLLAYFSKALPKSAFHYGISELELCGIYLAVNSFRHLLKNTVFECYTDHKSIPQILKSKAEPTSDRIKRLLEKLSSYAIKIGFRKGSTMVIADYLSRNPIHSDSQYDDIAFPMLTRHKARQSGVSIPTVRETLSNQTIKQVYKQPTPPPTPPSLPVQVENTTVPQAPPPVPPPAAPPPPAAMPHTGPPVHQRQANQSQAARPRPTVQTRSPTTVSNTTPTTLTTPHPLQRPPMPQPQNDNEVTETHSEPPASLLNSKTLQLDPDDVITKHLPKQTDIDKFLRKLDLSRIQNMHLPYDKRELGKLQSQCPDFKDLYAYIQHGLLPSPKLAAKRILSQADQYLMIDTILFKLPSDSLSDLRLVIPQSIVPEILHLYHDSLLAAHQGISRVTATLRQKFYFPKMHQQVVNYIRSCHICQARKSPVGNDRPFHLNIPTNYIPFQTVHADLKVLPPSAQQHKFLLVLVCNITRYVILAPLHSKDAQTVAEAVLQKCVFQFGPFQEFVSDQGREWDNAVVNYIFQALKVKQKFISVNNHQSNKSERFISTVSSLLTSYLTNNGKNWHLFTNAIAYAYNSFVSPALGNHSPFYLVYLRNPPTMFTCPPVTQVATGYHQYVNLLKDRLESIGKVMLDIQAKLQHAQAEQQNKKVKNPPLYTPGSLVYLLAPSSSALQIASRKLRLDFVGPFAVKEVLDRSHVILMTLDNKQLPTVIHVSRLKPAWIRCGTKSVNNMSELQDHSQKLFYKDPKGNHVLTYATIVKQTLEGVPNNSRTPRDSCYPVLSPNFYAVLRARYKHGSLQLLLDTKSTVKHNLWFSIDDVSQANFYSTASKIKISGSFSRFCDVFH